MPRSANPKRVTPKGRRVREAVLQAAVEIGLRDGLEAVSFGRLAKALGMSKSGLFSHFANKLELQVAAIEHAQQTFVNQVFQAELAAAPRGLPRLWTLCSSWLRYAQGTGEVGGCFFQALIAEYHNRPGPIRDLVKDMVVTFNAGIRRAIEGAQAEGHLRADVDPVKLGFELHSLMASTNHGYQLFRDPEIFAICDACLRERIEAAMTPEAPPLPR